MRLNERLDPSHRIVERQRVIRSNSQEFISFGKKIENSRSDDSIINFQPEDLPMVLSFDYFEFLRSNQSKGIALLFLLLWL